MLRTEASQPAAQTSVPHDKWRRRQDGPCAEGRTRHLDSRWRPWAVRREASPCSGTWSREQRVCVRPGGTPPPPGYKAALPTAFWGEYLLRAHVSPFFAPRIKLSLASEPDSVSVSFSWINGHWTERTLAGDRFRKVIGHLPDRPPPIIP